MVKTLNVHCTIIASHFSEPGLFVAGTGRLGWDWSAPGADTDWSAPRTGECVSSARTGWIQVHKDKDRQGTNIGTLLKGFKQTDASG